VHFGVILPNYGEQATPERMRRAAQTAEELGFDSVWATEHIAPGPEAADSYGRVYDPLVTLGWLAASTQRIGLGTSIVILPLHSPFHLAKQAATLQELSGRRLRLGVGVGWHRDEFDFLGVGFEGRGRRANEAIRLMRALWRSEPEFEGRYWSYREATFEPQPSPPPEIWIGGSSPQGVRRALRLGDVWHPSRRSDADHIRSVKSEHPDLRVIPRTSLEQVDAMLDAGAEGAVVTFPNDESMRDFARQRIGR
jgi:probable F420-dependent oxidoreductase